MPASPSLSPDQRIAGVLIPVFALRSEHDPGIGDTGHAAAVHRLGGGSRLRAGAAAADQRNRRRQQPVQRHQLDGARSDHPGTESRRAGRSDRGRITRIRLGERRLSSPCGRSGAIRPGQTAQAANCCAVRSERFERARPTGSDDRWRSIPGLSPQKRRVAGELHAVPRVDGSRTAAPNAGTAGRPSNKPPCRPRAWEQTLPPAERGRFRKNESLFCLRAMDRLRAVGSAQEVRRRTRRGVDGRHSAGGQLLQRGFFRQPGAFRAGLVGRRAAGTVFQG